MALTDLTRISTSGIATGSTIDAAILRKDVSFRGSQVGVTSALFDSSENELKFNDNSKLKFGDGGDVQLYWTGSAGFLTNQGAAGSNLHVNSDTVLIKNAANSKSHIRAYNNSSVEIFYNNNKKIETTKHGAVVTGILTATGFSGPTNNTSGIATFYDLRVSNNLTVEGTTTTLDTNLIGVDRVEVGANSNTLAGIAVTQSGTADIVRLYDGATQRVTVDDAGRVGIGSDIPVAHLDVANYQNIEVLRLRDRHFNKYLTIRGGGSPNRMIIDSYEGGGGGADIDLASNGSTKVRITSTGLVQIDTPGVTAGNGASAKLQVDSSSQYDGLLLGNAATYGTISRGANNGALVYTANAYPANLGGGEKITHEWWSGNAGGGGPDQLMVLSASGRLGIGLTTPAVRLHVQGTGNEIAHFTGANGGQLKFRNATNNIFLAYTNTSDIFQLGTNGQNPRVHIAVNGNVGINETNPSAQLHVENDNANSSTYYLNTDAAILVQNKNSSATAKTVLKLEGPVGSGDCALVYGAGGTNMIFADRQYERLRISSDGKVGIGITNPEAYEANGNNLVVGDTTSHNGITILTGTDKDGRLGFADGTGAASYRGMIEYQHGTGTDEFMKIAVAGDERLRITSDGKIGIGHHISTQITNGGSELTIRPANDGGILIGRPGDTVAPINKALTITTTTTGSEAYHTKYHTYNCNSIFATYEGGGTGGNFIFKTGVGSGQEEEKLRITSDGQLALNYLAHHTSVSGIFAANATTSGRFSYKAIEIGTAIASGTDQGALIVARRKASSSSPATLVGSWDDGTDVTLYYGGGWSSHAGSATRLNFYTDTYATGNNSGGTRLSIGSKGQIFLNNRDSNNSSHRGNIIAYAPPSGEFAYKSLEIGSTNSSSSDTGGLIVAQRKGTSAYPFALLGSWDNGSACTVYIGGGWGSQSANATQLNFYTSSNAGSGGSSGHVRLSIDTNGEAIFYKNVAVGGGHPWAVTGSPYNNLSISGSDASSSGFLNLGNGAAATNADFDLSRIKFHNGATEVATIRATTATSDSGDSHLRFFTKKAGSGTKEVLRIRNDGIVETMYSENQQSYANNISPTPCIRARNHYVGNGIYAGIQFFNQRTSGAAAVADIGVVNDASTDYVSYLTFTTRNSDTTYSEKIRIDDGGQIRYQYANNAKHAFALRETVRTITGHSTTGYQYVRCALLNSRTAYRCAVSTQGGNYGPGVQFFTVLRSWNSTTFYVTDKLNIGSAYANAVRMQSDNSGGTFYLEVNISLSTTSQGFNLSVTPLAANSGDMTTALQFYGSDMSDLTNTSSATSLV